MPPNSSKAGPECPKIQSQIRCVVYEAITIKNAFQLRQSPISCGWLSAGKRRTRWKHAFISRASCLSMLNRLSLCMCGLTQTKQETVGKRHFGKIKFFNCLFGRHLRFQPQEFSPKMGGLRTYGRSTIINDYDFPSSDMSSKALPN